jgi:phosphoglycerol transferase MdoB-like AlkP superfamily enzyme
MPPNAHRLDQRKLIPLVDLAGLVLFSSLLRLTLAVNFPPASQVSFADYIWVMLVGLHLDLVAGLILLTPVVFWCAFVPERWWLSRWHRSLSAFATGVTGTLLAFLFVAEGFFFQEFLSRFNPVAIDYLIYPHEVFTNIREVYPVPVVVSACVLLGGLIGWVAFVWSGRRSEERSPRSPKLAVGWLSLAVVAVLSVRHNEAELNRERTLNELASNTFIGLWKAATTRNLEYGHFYPTVPLGEAFRRSRELLAEPVARMTAASNSLQRHITGDPTKPRLNVVLLLEESLGSEFWGCLGRTNGSLTPRMDAVATKDAILFDNLYADGNRTIRGYEGVFSSFPPLPGDSIVARDRSENVETIARVLARDGYDTTFVYAGRGIFDGTGAFARANGWSNFVELRDFKQPVFSTVWGVCNEDLYDRILVECRDRFQKGRPFLMTSMSVSNHKPYTFPAGRIPEDPQAHRRDHVVKYTDYALGRFFDQARKEPFWTNTIFCMVADHGARVYGSQTIPIRSYEIPFLAVGPAVAALPRRCSTLGCQLDVAPTILGLIGRPYDSIFYGRDLLRSSTRTGRVLLHHNRSVGIYADRRLVVFNLNKRQEYFEGDPKREQMRRVEAPDSEMIELEQDAVALFQTADDLYMHRRYRVGVTSQ